ncbi:MAG: peptidoglycan-binding protein [Pseudorhodobacter sp.]|nr:peptidoglycan-binding protein [Pseudorhodobacter sp.]
MRQYLYLLTMVFGLFMGTAASAQSPVWVQIEAQPTLTQAQERARAYAAAFPDVAGFQMSSGWYAIVLGPYTDDAALSRLAELRRDNLIPSDSFISGGATFRQPFWPVGQNPASAPILNGLGSEAPEAPVVAAAPETAPEITPAPAPEPVVIALPDESPAEARRSEAALTRDERMDLQSALQWFGFYDAAIDGAFGRGTRASMAAWQEANGYEPTGVMTTAQRAEMLDSRARIMAELDLQTITEPEAGIEISLPMALVEFDHYEPPFVHYAAKNDSGVRVILISQPGDRATLFGLYDILQTLAVVPPSTDAHPGTRSRGDRSFSIEAASSTVASYSYAELSQGLIKGYMLIWTPDAADKAGRALGAMQSSFKPVGRRALDPGLVSLDETQRRNLLAGMEIRLPKLSRSGLFVSSGGAVLTTTEVLQNCGRITLDRDTEAGIAFQDEALGLALLTPLKELAPRHVAGFETGAPRIGGEIAVSGYSYEAALPAPTLTFGVLEDDKGLNGETGLNRLTLAALPGDAGGPVMDGSGTVLGMLLPRVVEQGRVLPAEVSFLATGAVIAAKLAENGIAVAASERNGALAPEDLTDMAASMTVLVSCWD